MAHPTFPAKLPSSTDVCLYSMAILIGLLLVIANNQQPTHIERQENVYDLLKQATVYMGVMADQEMVQGSRR